MTLILNRGSLSSGGAWPGATPADLTADREGSTIVPMPVDLQTSDKFDEKSRGAYWFGWLLHLLAWTPFVYVLALINIGEDRFYIGVYIWVIATIASFWLSFMNRQWHRWVYRPIFILYVGIIILIVVMIVRDRYYPTFHWECL